jgi:glycosyltransferase involved in cell wall biosynthesis
MSRPDLSVVILCYRSGNKIRSFISRVVENISSVTNNWEIVLVGNYVLGSQDDTPTVVKEISKQNPKIKAVTLPKKGWMGWDLRSGLRECSGNVIALIDGDEQMEANDISKAYRILIDEGFDIVMTYRQIRHDSWMRQLNSRIYNQIFNLLFPAYPIRDVHSKPKVFRREVFNCMKLTADDWFLDAQMMIQVRRYRFRLKQFPTVFHRATQRKSFVKVSTIWEFVINLSKARYYEFSAPKQRKIEKHLHSIPKSKSAETVSTKN